MLRSLIEAGKQIINTHQQVKGLVTLAEFFDGLARFALPMLMLLLGFVITIVTVGGSVVLLYLLLRDNAKINLAVLRDDKVTRFEKFIIRARWGMIGLYLLVAIPIDAICLPLVWKFGRVLAELLG